MTALPAGDFSLGIKNILLVTDGIIVPNTCASRTILFAPTPPQMALIVTLIGSLYYMDAPVVG